MSAFGAQFASWSDLGKWLAGRAGSSLNCVLGRRTERPLGILVYHRVSPAPPAMPFPSINVTPDVFRAQLVGLKRLGFRFISLREALRKHDASERVSPRTAVVTFDDGFASVHEHAWPVLRELQVPATIFVNTAYWGSAAPMPFDDWGLRYRDLAPAASYRPLSIEQCREMLAGGLVEIGTHTHTHADFRSRERDLEEDLRLSLRCLRDHLGLDRVSFAFPYGRKALGYVSRLLVEAARASGVTCSLTTEAEPTDPRIDPFDWGRFNVYQWDTGRTLAGKLGGWYGWAPLLQERLSLRRQRAVEAGTP